MKKVDLNPELSGDQKTHFYAYLSVGFYGDMCIFLSDEKKDNSNLKITTALLYPGTDAEWRSSIFDRLKSYLLNIGDIKECVDEYNQAYYFIGSQFYS